MMPDRSSETGPLDARAVLLIVSILVSFWVTYYRILIMKTEYEAQVQILFHRIRPIMSNQEKIGRENL